VRTTLRERIDECLANAWCKFMTAPYGTQTFHNWRECYVRLSTLRYEIDYGMEFDD
jgi:hypothetical protein